MPLTRGTLPKPSSVTPAEAEAAIALRPDIPPDVVKNARAAGPAVLYALAKNAPTPGQLSDSERRDQVALVLKDAREQAQRAAEATAVLEGDVAGGGDALRREVFEVLSGHAENVKKLAWWAAYEASGKRLEPSKLRVIVEVARVVELRTALHKTHTIIQSAIAESHVPKRRKR